MEASENTLSKKHNKKLQNKLKRKAINLVKEYSITVVDNPSPNLYLGNTGMLCGYSREYLLNLFKRFGKVKMLIQPPQKSFSFLSYYSMEEARLAKESLNNCDPIQRKTSEPNIPILIHYLSSIPLAGSLSKSYPKDGETQFDIDGLNIITDFVTLEEETKLVNYFIGSQMCNGTGTLKHRTVQHFGYEFLYGTSNIDKSKPLNIKIPDICESIQNKLMHEKFIPWKFDQLTVNTYEPGQGIPSHIDTHSAFEDCIVSLTLNSQTVMEFSHPNGQHIPVILPRRSLLIMKRAARYLWTHGIVPRKHDIIYVQDNEVKDSSEYHLSLKERGKRISLTFRKILHIPCRCSFHTQCDSYMSEKSDKLYVPESSTQANHLEGEHVHDVYDEIADHFSSTRHSPWPHVKNFIMSLEKGSVVADIGCGNGKYLGVDKDLVMIGSDRSWNLCDISSDRGYSVLQSDITNIPFREKVFDACICIAVIHHLSTDQRRLEAITELVRITRVNGLILIYVWAIEQSEESSIETPSNEPLIDRTRTDSDNESAIENEHNFSMYSERKEIQVSQGRNTFQQQDLLIPWHLKGDGEKVYHRFYHVFKQGELEDLCKKIQGIEINKIYYDKGNWCVILKRIS